jgi:hypothetical protein
MSRHDRGERLTRRAAWLAGVLAALAVALAPGVPREVAAIRPALALVVLLTVGLLGEVLVLLRAVLVGPASRSPLPARDARPADGVIEVVPLRGVRATPCAADARFARFVAWDGSDRSHRVAALPMEPGPLLGRVAVVSLFVGRDGADWTDGEIAKAHRAIERAAGWVEREAMRWGAPVNLEIAGVYFASRDDREDDVEVGFGPEGDVEAPLEVAAVTRAVASTSRAAARLGFADLAELVAQVEARVTAHADAVVWLVHPRCGGRSIAVLPDERTLPGVSLAVCFAREANFTEPLRGRPPFTDPVTIVHELLHLFGASDKYHDPLHAFPAGLVSERDVMCLYHESLPRLRVDRLTAQELGWVGPRAETPAGRGGDGGRD